MKNVNERKKREEEKKKGRRNREGTEEKKRKVIFGLKFQEKGHNIWIYECLKKRESE